MDIPILYVEDDRDVRAMLKELLEAEGYDVTACATAEEAIVELERRRYPLCLTDYNLPERNADWLVRVAAQRGLLETTAVIVLSGAVDPRGIDGHPFLQKPVDIEQLLSTIDHALSGRLEARAAAPVAAPAGEGVTLKLYFAGTSRESKRAVRNLRRALRQFDESRITLEIHDIAEDNATRALDEDRIVVTPTLVRKHPLPKLWILGDLSAPGVVEDMISASLAGTGPPRSALPRG